MSPTPEDRHAPGYDTDPVTRAVEDSIREVDTYGRLYPETYAHEVAVAAEWAVRIADAHDLEQAGAAAADDTGPTRKIIVTPKQAAALSRLLDAYLATEEHDPGHRDLEAVQTKVNRLEHDHSRYA